MDGDESNDLEGMKSVSVGKVTVKTILMHDPFGLFTARGSAFVEDKSLLHTKQDTTGCTVNLLVLASGLPVASSSCSVCS